MRGDLYFFFFLPLAFIGGCYIYVCVYRFLIIYILELGIVQSSLILIFF